MTASTPDASTDQSSTVLEAQTPAPRSVGGVILRVFLILLGLGIGGIVAIVIGLAMGWIPFTC